MENARRIRKAQDLSLETVAADIGISVSQLSRAERGEKMLKLDEMQRLAQRLGVSVSEIIDARPIPVVGYAGAGGDTVFEPITGEQDTVYGPADAPAQTVAVKIRGDSLGIGFDGWYALYADRRDPITDDFLNKLCIVGTQDGRTLIKWVRRGPDGRFTLVSGTGHIEEDVSVEWAARVIDIKPS